MNACQVLVRTGDKLNVNALVKIMKRVFWFRTLVFFCFLTETSQGAYSSAVTTFKQAREEDVLEIVEKAKGKLLIEKGHIFTVHQVSMIVHRIRNYR